MKSFIFFIGLVGFTAAASFAVKGVDNQGRTVVCDGDACYVKTANKQDDQMPAEVTTEENEEDDVTPSVLTVEKDKDSSEESDEDDSDEHEHHHVPQEQEENNNVPETPMKSHEDEDHTLSTDLMPPHEESVWNFSTTGNDNDDDDDDNEDDQSDENVFVNGKKYFKGVKGIKGRKL